MESVIIAILGALFGIAIGIFFGWALQQALAPEGITEFVLPVGQLVFFLIFAALAGVVVGHPPGPASRQAQRPRGDLVRVAARAVAIMAAMPTLTLPTAPRSSSPKASRRLRAAQGHDRGTGGRRAPRLCRSSPPPTSRRRGDRCRTRRTDCTCCVTPPPTCWRRPSAISSPGRSTRSARRRRRLLLRLRAARGSTSATTTSRTHRARACGDREAEPAVRARGARRRRRRSSCSPISPSSARSSSGLDAERRPTTVGEGDGESPSTQPATTGFVDLCRGPARAAHRQARRTSSSRRSPAPTGAATRRTRSSSASTAPRGRRKDDSTSTCTAWRKPSGATTASSALELDLFSFPDEIGSGLAVFHPKGGTDPPAHGGLLARSATRRPATSS